MTLLIADNPFEQVTLTRRRPGFIVEPLAIAWGAVAFRVTGERGAVACVPRAELDDFFASLDSGRLDASVIDFLRAAPSGRVLRAADQATTTGLFDSMASADAIVPAERVAGPARALGLGGGGGAPADARRRKRQRPRGRVPRALVAGVAAAVVVAGAAVAVAASGGGGGTKVAENATTTSTSTSVTTTSLAPEIATARALVGTWTVTRTVTASDAPRQPIGSVTQFPFVFSSTCMAAPCAMHVDMQGIIGAVEAADLTYVGDHYEGVVTGNTPCRSFTTDEVIGETAIDGTIKVLRSTANQWTGSMDLHLTPNANCNESSISYDLTAVK